MNADGSPTTTGAWRRGREVFDAYDADRVLSESLADDLVNDLVGLPTRGRRAVVPGRFALPRRVRPAGSDRTGDLGRAHLSLVRP